MYEIWSQIIWLDLLGVVWLLSCWLGYSIFAKRRAKRVHCLSSVLQTYRKQWMTAMLQRDNRVGDAALLANLERNANFLASTSILVIAGLVTTLASIEKVHEMLGAMPFSLVELTALQLQFKITLLLLIYIYSFFTFTWSMRQYGFCAIVLGAAPNPDDANAHGEEGKRFAKHAAKIIDQAGHSYNYGLRAYYFSLSVLAWLINTWVFVVAVAAVVVVLYAREYHSKSLRSLIQVGDLQEGNGYQ